MNESFYIAHQRKADGATQSLESHLCEVADISKKFADKIGLKKQGEIIGLLHDLGKYSKAFQDYLKSAVGLYNQDEDEDFVNAQDLKGKVDHSTAGAQLVWKELADQGNLSETVGQILALCIASHHSGLIDCLSLGMNSPIENNFERRIKKPDLQSHLNEAKSKMDPSVAIRFSELIRDPQIVSGLKAVLHRIARRDKNEGVVLIDNLVVQFKIGLLVRFLFSCLIDADRISTANFEYPKFARNQLAGQNQSWDILIERLGEELAKFEKIEEIDKIRKQISDDCQKRASIGRGIYTLTVPTGGGKTLASLRFALHHAKTWGMDRIIYIIPFTTIIDQNAEVVRKILEKKEDGDPIVLEHHSNLTPDAQGWREKILSENWDAPIVFTTNVQFLESLFGAGTRGARRMHQMANSVLVFDEIQTIPVNCVHLFNNAVNFLVECCGSTAVLCTATQPLLNRVDRTKGALCFAEASEIMPSVKRLFSKLKRVEVFNRCKPGGWTNEDISALALDEASKSGSCLVIVNTKVSARVLFQLCRDKNKIPVYHLSTNMCPAHRKEILERIQGLLPSRLLPKRGSPVICISTQLIEAGVDIDFGAVIRFTAGLDSVAQAAGRCNRNKLRGVGRVHVLNPADENLDRLQDIRVGVGVTQRILDDVETEKGYFDGLLSPKAMESYFKYYFFARQNEMSYGHLSRVIGRDDTLLSLLSCNKTAVDEFMRSDGKGKKINFLRQSFMSAAKAFKAIDVPTRGVIVPYRKIGQDLVRDLCSAVEVEKQYKMLRLAQQYTVNVFPYVLDQLKKNGAVHRIQQDTDILYLSNPCYYNHDSGLAPIAD